MRCVWASRVLAVAAVLCAGACHGPPASARGRGGGDSAGAQVAPYRADVAALANANPDFRRVIATGDRTQLVLMSLPPGGDVGEETHRRVEQIFFCVSGRGQVTLNGAVSPFGVGDVVIAPPGTRHDVTNTGSAPLKLYTIYSPPNHLDGRVQATKAAAEADRADQDFGRRVEMGRSPARRP
ncbi:MAG TPA: cupin domain-containing protein [Polyangia bacterium]|jgi:mannose-6-phosphate isomerase-like protein (cupin superfamily)